MSRKSEKLRQQALKGSRVVKTEHPEILVRIHATSLDEETKSVIDSLNAELTIAVNEVGKCDDAFRTACMKESLIQEKLALLIAVTEKDGLTARKCALNAARRARNQCRFFNLLVRYAEEAKKAGIEFPLKEYLLSASFVPTKLADLYFLFHLKIFEASEAKQLFLIFSRPSLNFRLSF